MSRSSLRRSPDPASAEKIVDCMPPRRLVSHYNTIGAQQSVAEQGLARARKRRRGGRSLLADVARLAEVSTATVSRALNKPAAVSPELRARIGAAVEALQYRPNLAARMLAAQRSWTVATIVPTLRNDVFASLLEAAQARFEEAGYTLLVGSSGHDPKRELHLIEAFVARGVDGMITTGTAHLPEVYATLEQSRVPFVNQGVYDPEGPYPSIGFNNRAAAALAVRHLLGLGHRRIGMVAGIAQDNDRAAGRIAGFRETLEAEGPPGWRAPVVEEPYTIEGGRRGFRALMVGSDPNAERPSAIVCGNDILAQGVLFEARESGIAVGPELSIIGFDDLELSGQLGLSSVRIPTTEIGQLAAEYILKRIAGETPPHAIEVRISIAARASTAAPA
ncbi:MAG TPA: LacI family DNA-binding transcriptional regulator [Acetobacteraceae bacterium]|nr:LacI family DNA-binding transcriptional regulator [Acetobacteraceae bacterium]